MLVFPTPACIQTPDKQPHIMHTCSRKQLRVSVILGQLSWKQHRNICIHAVENNREYPSFLANYLGNSIEIYVYGDMFIDQHCHCSFQQYQHTQACRHKTWLDVAKIDNRDRPHLQTSPKRSKDRDRLFFCRSFRRPDRPRIQRRSPTLTRPLLEFRISKTAAVYSYSIRALVQGTGRDSIPKQPLETTTKWALLVPCMTALCKRRRDDLLSLLSLQAFIAL